MKYTPPLIEARLLRRYKRFLADVEVGGKEITVHCANTGSMKNCVVEGSPCWLWDSCNEKRKYRHTLEMVTTSTGDVAGINTMRANQLVEEALVAKRIPQLSQYDQFRREVDVGESRVDFALDSTAQTCFLEVKSVTLGVEGGLGLFPDAKSERASKHLHSLMRLKSEGNRAVLLFCVQHTGINRVAAAKEIDPRYAEALWLAREKGVEVLAFGCEMDACQNTLVRQLEVL